jgi:hypothetical protein
MPHLRSADTNARDGPVVLGLIARDYHVIRAGIYLSIYNIHTYIYIYRYIYIHIYINIYVCVCVCVCGWGGGLIARHYHVILAGI